MTLQDWLRELHPPVLGPADRERPRRHLEEVRPLLLPLRRHHPGEPNRRRELRLVGRELYRVPLNLGTNLHVVWFSPPDHKSNFNPQTTPFLMGAIEVIFWVQFLKSSIAITSRT